MKLTIDKQYLVKEFDKSLMFKMPQDSKYKDYIMFYNKEFCNVNSDEVELNIKDGFVLSLRNKAQEEIKVSATQLNEVFKKNEEVFNTTWSFEKKENGVVLAIGNDNEEYIIGNEENFVLSENECFQLKNKEGIILCENWGQAEFYFNDKLEAQKGLLNSDDEILYQNYINGTKKKVEEAFDDWYNYVESRTTWVKEKDEYQAMTKMDTYVNDKSYEKSIPYALRSRKQFIVWKWKYDEDRKKAIKVPMNPWKPGEYAKSNDSFTWATFDKCCEVVNKYESKFGYAGIGIMFGNGVMGIDFDHCIIDGKCDPGKKELVDKINSYTEYSPSGDGLHIIAFGKVPEGYGNRNDISGVECYDHARFFTLTGKLFEGKIRTMKSVEETKLGIESLAQAFLIKKEAKIKPSERKFTGITMDDEKILTLIRKGVRNDTFTSLYDKGEVPLYKSKLLNLQCMKQKNHSENVPLEFKDNETIKKFYEKDHSACDTLLCGIIASYTDNSEQIDRIYRKSALMRDKWDSYRGDKTYGQILCETVLNNVKYKYQGKSNTRNFYGRKNSQMKMNLKIINEEQME